MRRTTTKNSIPELVKVEDQHVIKFHGKDAPYTARAFFKIPLMLPLGEYLVLQKDGKLHLYGIKNDIPAYQIDGAAAAVEIREAEVSETGYAHATLVIHRDVLDEPKGAFPLVRKLLTVAEQVQQYHDLRSRTYRPGEEEQKTRDLAIQQDLIAQIHNAHTGQPPEVSPVQPLSSTDIPDPGEKIREAIRKVQDKDTGFPKVSRE